MGIIRTHLITLVAQSTTGATFSGLAPDAFLIALFLHNKNHAYDRQNDDYDSNYFLHRRFYELNYHISNHVHQERNHPSEHYGVDYRKRSPFPIELSADGGYGCHAGEIQ